VNRENRLRLPVKLKAEPSEGKAGGEKPKEPQTAEDMWKRLSETLERNINMVGAARSTREFMFSPGGDGAEKPSAVRPFQELVEAAKLFGVDFGGLMARMSEESRALREATDAKEREIHELRLKEYAAMEERIKNAAAETARVREGEKGKGLPFGFDGLDPEVKKRIEERVFGLAEPSAKAGGFSALFGLDGLDPEVKKRIEERVFGLTPPAGGDSQKPAQPAPFTQEWFEQWGQMRPAIETFVRMFGFVSREEVQAGRGNSQQPLVSMEEVAGGKVPLELALGLRRLELEDRRETLRLEREHDERMERNRIFSGIRDTIDKNAPDAIAALRDMAREHNRAAEIVGPGGPEALEGPRLKGIRCSECGYEFAVAEERESYRCPACGATLKTPGQQPEASVGE
jgi:rubrerythrin